MIKKRKTPGHIGEPRRVNWMRVVMAVLIILIAIISYFGARSFNPITTSQQVKSITRHQEIALGIQAAPDMIARYGGLDSDVDRRARVQAMGQELLKDSFANQKGWEFDFQVLNNTVVVNAFALPGGKIFITRALVDMLETDGQLAGILGHQIGHVITRHAAEQIVEAEQTQGLIAALSTQPGRTRSGAVMAINEQLVNPTYSRDDEIESDYYGVRIMSEAGYDPRAMIKVMKLLGQQDFPPDFFETHPNPEDRVDSLREVILVLFPGGIPEGLRP